MPGERGLWERSADHAVGIHGRAAELARIGLFLDAAADQPAAPLIEGDASQGAEIARRRRSRKFRSVAFPVRSMAARYARAASASRPSRRSRSARMA